MKKGIRTISAMALALVMVFAFVACGQQSDTQSEGTETMADTQTENEETKNITESSEEKERSTEDSDEKILVYLSGPEAMINKLEETFEEENGDVLDMTIMSCGQLRNKVWTENEAGNIQADVIWGSDPLVYNKLDEAGALEQLNIKDIDSINEKYVWEGKNYALVNERYIAIIYNKDMLSEDAPKSFADLTDERYKGQVTMADATQSSTAFAIGLSLYELEGNSSEYFEQLKNNQIMLTKSNGLVPSNIMEGQIAIGIAPHDSFVRLTNKGKKEGYEVPLNLVWPSEGTIAIQRPIAIPVNENRSESKEEIAEKFVNFLMSNKAQKITTNFGFVSVRNDIENTYLPENAKVFSVDWDKATENEETIKNEYQEIFH